MQLVAEIEKIKLSLPQNSQSSDLQQRLPRIVHQINNPLSAISGYAQLIQRNMCNGAALEKCIQSILAAVRQISRINRDIMNAGRDEANACRPIEINTLLNVCLEMSQGLFLLKDIQVERKMAGHSLWIQGDLVGLEQVFRNLIKNAVDAMDDRMEMASAWKISRMLLKNIEARCSSRARWGLGQNLLFDFPPRR